MSAIVTAKDLTEKDKKLLFWGSFLSLAAAGTGFAFRLTKGGEYGQELALTFQEVGQIMGASFWPIAVTMILFSLVVDRTGYKAPMYFAFALQAASAVMAFRADSYEALYYASVCAGLGHGIVEAVINPVCAAVYPNEKTKRLTILHAAWPAGVAGGALLIIGADSVADLTWHLHALWLLLPAAAYALMYLPCRFPVDERVQAGVPYMVMLKQVGFLTATLASILLTYELGNALGFATGNWLMTSALIGGAIGVGFGVMVKSVGKPLFFLMCCLMMPVATAELSTDAFIQPLMQPVLQDMDINPTFAIVFSMSIMLLLRVFAGSILQFFTPPTLLATSGLLSAVGLFWLSGATGAGIFVAFVLYAVGQTYYWPCILGFTSERYPEGGALTLNTVSAMGLLTMGVIGTPLLGVAFDETIHESLKEREAAFVEQASADGVFLGTSHEKVDPLFLIKADEDGNENKILDREEMTAGFDEAGKARMAAGWAWMDADAERADRIRTVYGEEKDKAGRSVLRYAARFPGILVIAFGIIALYFRSRGGYKPVQLSGSNAH